MKKETMKRNTLSVLVVCIMHMATLLTACSSGQAAATPANEEATKAEVTEEAPAVEQAEEVATPEPTAEPTPEPEVENSKYSDIDMESTLPGLEWLATLDEIVDEPLVVVYNDETNKKLIVQEGDEVEFSRLNDVLALYTPNNETMTIMTLSGWFDYSWEGGNKLPDSMTSKRRIMCKRGETSSDSEQKCSADIMLNGELKQYEFVLKFVD